MSLLLDKLLGKEGTLYRRGELKQLVHLHGEEYRDEEGDIERVRKSKGGGAEEEVMLCQDEVNIIKGALDMKGKTVMVPMTPIEQVWMLSDEECLDEATINAVCCFLY